jgi:PAS domain S-box-containing protein
LSCKYILIVEDGALIADDLKRRLERSGYTITGIAATGIDAINMAREQRPNLILMDIRLRGAMDGIEAAEAIHQQFDIPIVYLTAHTDPETIARAKQTCPYGYIVKPFGTTDVRTHIEMAYARYLMEKELSTSRSWLDATLQSVGDAVIAVDISGRISLLNPAAEELTGWKVAEALGRDLLDVFVVADETTSEPVANPVQPFLRDANARVERRSYKLSARNGSSAVIEASISAIRGAKGPLGVVVAFRDLRAQRMLEERARHAQKMDALAVLAGGVAHDFNNLLTIILGYTDVLTARLGTEDRALTEIWTAAKSAASLTRQLMTLSRNEVARPEPADLNTIISGSLKMLQQILGATGEVRLALSPDPALVLADGGQIRQILVSLVTYAHETMPKPGWVEISTVTELPNGFIELLFKCDGRTLSGGRDKVFEPFAAPRGQGNGNNLGLAIVHSIAVQNGGSVDVRDNGGQGNIFQILLPKAERHAVPPPLPAVAKKQAPVNLAGATVLLVEDEDNVRDLLRRRFEGAGFRMLEAQSGDEALKIARAHQGPIDLLITDVMMPVMTGPELANLVAGKRPDMRVIFMSGFSGDQLQQNALLRAGTARFVSKPFTPDELVAIARQTLAPELAVQ